MLGIVDIHCHILPKVDDGSGSVEETMHMLETAYEEGVRTIVATPHYHPGRGYANQGVVLERLKEIQELVEMHYTGLRIYRGNEVVYHDSIVEDLDQNICYTMNETDYVLVEFHPSHTFDYIRKGAAKVLQGGYIPIIAHVERYMALLKKPDYVKQLVEMGCLIQINAGSVMGNMGLKTKGFCKKLLKKGWVHFIATDAHKQSGSRTMAIEQCAKYIERKYGSDYATQLLVDNPEMMLQGMDI